MHRRQDDTAPEHRVHGFGLALEPPSWPAITAAEAEAIVSRFPEAGGGIELLWHSPRPFSAAALLRTDRGTLFLKRHHARVRTPDALAEEHRFAAHLHRAGLPVPAMLATVDGATAVGDGDWSYELGHRAPGLDLYRDRQSWTPFLSHGHARAAGAMLARLHRAARGFAAPARPLRPLVASFTILPAADPLAAAEAFVAARPALAAFLSTRRWRQELASLLTGSGELSTRLAAEPALWTHGDWHPSNLLWTADGQVGTVFDFGLATRTCALHDLAIAIERTAFSWLHLDEGADRMATDPAAMRALLAGYASVAPLDPEAVRTIADLLPLVHLEFALSEIDYFSGVLGDAAGAALAWDGYLLGHAAWFRTSAGRDFLARLTDGAG